MLTIFQMGVLLVFLIYSGDRILQNLLVSIQWLLLILLLLNNRAFIVLMAQLITLNFATIFLSDACHAILIFLLVSVLSPQITLRQIFGYLAFINF